MKFTTVKHAVIVPNNPETRVFILDWNETQETLSKALDRLGRGLSELNCASAELDCEIRWHAYYLIENASIDLGIVA